MWIRAEAIKPVSGLLIKDLPAFDIFESKPAIINFPYSILLTQPCDLDEFCRCLENKASLDTEKEENIGRQVITQVIFCPAFDEALFSSGTHLKEQYDYRMRILPKPELEKYANNQHVRYHYIKSKEPDIPSFFIDFKQYFTLPALFVKKFIEEKRGMNEYCLEHLSYTCLADRFAYYLQRVALPGAAAENG